MGGSFSLYPSKVPRSSSSLIRAHSRGSFSRLVLESESSNGEYATSFTFFLCQIMVITFRLITPLSYLGVLAYIFYPLRPDMFWGPCDGYILYCFLLVCMTAECIFFPYYLYIFTMSNERNVELRHFARCTNSRMKLIKDCFDAMEAAGAEGGLMDRNPEMYLRKVLEGWHFDQPLGEIYKENFAAWAAWAFWDKNLNELLTSERKELENVVSYVEKKVKWKFQEGFNPNTPNARLTLDPVFATQRPFFFYATIWALNFLCHIILYCCGWRIEKDFCARGQTIYRRHARRSVAGGSTNIGNVDRLPIFVIHGLGIGYIHYLAVLLKLPRDVDVYLMEWPHVNMQLTTTVPKNEDTTRIMNAVLEAHGHEAACFLAHSLGTTAVSWMLKDKVGRGKVAATVMLDPVVFLLCDPTVATNFVYKPPRNTIDFLMHFFISRELFIGRALSRHFNWSHNIMFVEELFADTDTRPKGSFLNTGEGIDADWDYDNPPLEVNHGDLGIQKETESHKERASLRHTIILSSADGIIPIGPVSRYLHAKSGERAATGKQNFEVVMFHGQHGEMMVYPSWIRKIAAYVDEKL